MTVEHTSTTAQCGSEIVGETSNKCILGHDIVERLRRPHCVDQSVQRTMDEAAEEIESLRAQVGIAKNSNGFTLLAETKVAKLQSELAAARKALEKIAGHREYDFDEDCVGPSDRTIEEYIADCALAALSSKEPEGK